MTRERLSSTDTAMLRVEDPVHPNVGTGVMVLGAPVDFERLKLTVEARLLCFDRFRQRIVEPFPWTTPRWEHDPTFDLRYHLQQLILPPPGDQAALQELVSLLASIPLDMSRPLWQLYLVEPYGSGCALICQVHHSLADGMALMHVLLSLADTDPDAPECFKEPGHRPAVTAGSWRSRLLSGPRAATRLARQGVRTLAGLPRPTELARLGWRAATAVKGLLLSRPDPDTPLRGEPGVPKRAVWSAPIPLADVKTIGRRLGGSVNDVLLTGIAGALRRYLLDRGESLCDLGVHALVPISLRSRGTEEKLGNRIGIVFLPLPVDIADPVDRLRELKKQMDNRKHSLEAPVILAGMTAFGRAPSGLVKPAVDYLCSKATVVVTNLKGPQQPIYLAGVPIDEFMFWIPRLGGIGLGISIMSYAGEVRVGAISDECIVCDPEVVLARFHDEFDALLALARETEEAPTMDKLLAKLDDALTTLDGLLAGRAGEHEPARREVSAKK